MPPTTPGGARRVRRGNPMLRERLHDPYKMDAKLRAPRLCTQCGVVYRDGRWRWPTTGDEGGRTTVCPACRRVNDHYPAGEVLLAAGEFLAAHDEELLALVHNVAAAENAEHPLNRLIDVTRTDDGVLVTTTDVHLPRRIGHALEAAWGGELKTHYDEEGYFTRVRWQR